MRSCVPPTQPCSSTASRLTTSLQDRAMGQRMKVVPTPTVQLAHHRRHLLIRILLIPDRIQKVKRRATMSKMKSPVRKPTRLKKLRLLKLKADGSLNKANKRQSIQLTRSKGKMERRIKKLRRGTRAAIAAQTKAASRKTSSFRALPTVCKNY